MSLQFETKTVILIWVTFWLINDATIITVSLHHFVGILFIMMCIFKSWSFIAAIDLAGKEHFVDYDFIKLGLHPKELKNALENKIENFGYSRDREVLRKVKVAMDSVRKKVSIKPKDTRPNEMDRRYTTIAYEEMILSINNEEEIAEMMYEDSRQIASPIRLRLINCFTRRGSTSFSKTLGKIYHRDQDLLLQLLPRFLNIHPKNTSNELEIKEHCSVIDYYTRQLFVHGMRPSLENVNLDTIQKLCKMFSLCERIVIGRIITDWISRNNLTKPRQLSRWMSHVHAILSFTAMMTALLFIIQDHHKRQEYDTLIRNDTEYGTMLSGICRRYMKQPCRHLLSIGRGNF